MPIGIVDSTCQRGCGSTVHALRTGSYDWNNKTITKVITPNPQNTQHQLQWLRFQVSTLGFQKVAVHGYMMANINVIAKKTTVTITSVLRNLVHSTVDVLFHAIRNRWYPDSCAIHLLNWFSQVLCLKEATENMLKQCLNREQNSSSDDTGAKNSGTKMGRCSSLDFRS